MSAELTKTISLENTTNGHKQKVLLLGLTIIFLVVALSYGFYWFFYGRYIQSTDNAYVNGNIVPVLAQVTGNVIKIAVDETELVKQGQVLVKIDPTDSLIALESAKAMLAQTLRQTTQLFINNRGLHAAIEARRTDTKKTSNDLQRRLEAVKVGGISEEELKHAEDNHQIAEASLIQAHTAWQANQAMIKNTTIKKHPAVLQAIAAVKQAYINCMRTTIRAPVTGYVSRRTVQIGQRLVPGSVLMAIVPLNEIWVDANFKESQLDTIRQGQPVKLTADRYGSAVQFHGQVIGFSAGTGSAFSLLPAQNATGNWIKIVQRLPVRIVIDHQELTKYPLQIGLSMEASVNTSQKSAVKIVYKPTYQTPIYNNLEKQADRFIDKIINENNVYDSGN